MRLVDRAVAMLEVLTAADIADPPPAERRRLAHQCRRAADLAESRSAAPRSGVLADLRRGSREW